MSAVELIALAASTSLLAGWRLYLVTLVTGLAMKFGWVALPDQLQALDVLANNWVLAAAALGTFAEFFADKIAWVDSAWDAVHSFIRPLGGALLSLAIVDSGDTGVAGRKLPARRRRGVRRPCRQGRRAHPRQRQPRTVQQHRRLDRRGCRHRRPARARHRQPDRRRARRRLPRRPVALAGRHGPPHDALGGRAFATPPPDPTPHESPALDQSARTTRAGRSPPASSPPACRSSRAACSTSPCPRSAPATAPAPPTCNGSSTPISCRCRRCCCSAARSAIIMGGGGCW